jgi:dTDP-4-dehydrorhamnose 3,5-epimerase-like enzyme
MKKIFYILALLATAPLCAIDFRALFTTALRSQPLHTLQDTWSSLSAGQQAAAHYHSRHHRYSYLSCMAY